MASSISNQILRDGDTSFVGMQSRRNPLTIDAKYVQLSQNMRFDRGIAQPRMASKRMASGLVTTSSVPISLPFQLTTPGPTIRDRYSGGLYSAGVYSSPVYQNSNEYIVMVGPSSVFLWRWDSSTSSAVQATLNYPSGDVVQNGDITLTNSSCSDGGRLIPLNQSAR